MAGQSWPRFRCRVEYRSLLVTQLGSLCINLGQNLMSAGHRKRAASEAAEAETASTAPLLAIRKIREWQVGVTIFAVGNVCNFGSFGAL